jgi:hypothetical protein
MFLNIDHYLSTYTEQNTKFRKPNLDLCSRNKIRNNDVSRATQTQAISITGPFPVSQLAIRILERFIFFPFKYFPQ